MPKNKSKKKNKESENNPPLDTAKIKELLKEGLAVFKPLTDYNSDVLRFRVE